MSYDGEASRQILPSATSSADPITANDDHSRPDLESAPLAPFRMLLASFLAALIGLVAGVVAFALYKLIGLFTNLFFFHRWSADFSSAQHNHLGWLVIVIPVIGGLIVGAMAKYGTSKIKGHGIPEAMEAVLFNRSRIAPRESLS
jgi:chloride channel protein, CIC family